MFSHVNCDDVRGAGLLSGLITSAPGILRSPICQATSLPVFCQCDQVGEGARVKRLLTGGKTVTAGVAFQFLLAVLAVEVIFTGGAQVHCERERRKWRTIVRCNPLWVEKNPWRWRKCQSLTYGTRWRADVRGCWRAWRPSASWCGGRRAGDGVCGGLDSWLPRGSSSNSSRKWSTPPAIVKWDKEWESDEGKKARVSNRARSFVV